MNNFEEFILNYDNLKKNNDIFSYNTSTTLVANAPCNLSCKYCYLDNCHSKQAIEFCPEKLEPVLKQYSNIKNENISIWMGEPLFNKELFVALCNFINKILPNHNITIFTNGTLINDWWADFFKDHKVYIKLSHDGPGQKYRGFDYLSSEQHIKAIKKIYKNGNLCGVNTTIHKFNYSFFDILNFFQNFENKTGIEFTTQSRCLVGLNLVNEIVYNFDYLDKNLIQYITDSYTFLFKKLLNDNIDSVLKYFPSDTLQDTLPILKLALGLPATASKTSCKKKSFAINGMPYCVYGVYSQNLPKVCYDDKEIFRENSNKCLKCTIKDICPSNGCTKVNANNNSCDIILSRYKTVYKALTELTNKLR